MSGSLCCWRWCNRFSLKRCGPSRLNTVIPLIANGNSPCIISSENTPSWLGILFMPWTIINSWNTTIPYSIRQKTTIMRWILKQTKTRHNHPHEEGQISSKKETRLPILPMCESPPRKPQLVVTWSLFWKALGRDTVVRLGMSILHRTYQEAPSRMT